MVYTKYTEQCCRTLAEAKEHPTDELLPTFVQTQELAGRIFTAFSYDNLNNAEIQGEFITALTTDSFMRDLDQLRLSLSPNLWQSSKNPCSDLRIFASLVNKSRSSPSIGIRCTARSNS